MQITFTYTSNPPMDRTGCTDPQCLYNGAPLPLSIPLLPLWTAQPVQSLSACTTVHFTFTYTSNPPMDRTACTEPQCLYNGALYLFTPYSSLSLVIQQVRSFFQSEFSGECDLVLPL